MFAIGSSSPLNVTSILARPTILVQAAVSKQEVPKKGENEASKAALACSAQLSSDRSIDHLKDGWMDRARWLDQWITGWIVGCFVIWLKVVIVS